MHNCNFQLLTSLVPYQLLSDSNGVYPHWSYPPLELPSRGHEVVQHWCFDPPTQHAAIIPHEENVSAWLHVIELPSGYHANADLRCLQIPPGGADDHIIGRPLKT